MIIQNQNIGSVLITGGTGYFGMHFVKRLLDQDLSRRICIYSRDEFKQSQMRKRFNADKRLRFFIGDVRDKDRLQRAMQGVDVAVHAAALKRIEVGHYNPEEMVKTNVLGTMNLCDAALDSKVKKVVFLSSDKAFQPVSAYGQSKAIAESVVLAANNHWGTRFSIVRYGNVAGSTGSVIPIWRELVSQGLNTVPVSDPNVTRFWMSIGEAVYLVLSTIHKMKGGEVSIPSLPAYRLGDLADAMGVSMSVKGLGEYEKLHESMRDGESSEFAKRMTVEEIKEALKHVK